MPKPKPEETAEEPKEPKPKESKPKVDELPIVVQQGILEFIKSIASWSPFGVAVGYFVVQNQIVMAVLVAVLGFAARVVYVV